MASSSPIEATFSEEQGFPVSVAIPIYPTESNDEGGSSDGRPRQPPVAFLDEDGTRFRIPSDGPEDYVNRRVYKLTELPVKHGLFRIDPIRRNCYGEPDPTQPPLRPLADMAQEREEERRRKEAKRKREERKEPMAFPLVPVDDDGCIEGVPFGYLRENERPPSFDFPIGTPFPFSWPPSPPRREKKPEKLESILGKQTSSDEDELRDEYQYETYDDYLDDNWHLLIDEETYAQCQVPFDAEDFKDKKEIAQEKEEGERNWLFAGLSNAKRRRLNEGSSSLSGRVLSAMWEAGKSAFRLLTSRLQD